MGMNVGETALPFACCAGGFGEGEITFPFTGATAGGGTELALPASSEQKSCSCPLSVTLLEQQGTAVPGHEEPSPRAEEQESL